MPLDGDSRNYVLRRSDFNGRQRNTNSLVIEVATSGIWLATSAVRWRLSGCQPAMLTTIRILKIPPRSEFEGFDLRLYMFAPGEVAAVPRSLAEALLAGGYA